MSSHTYISAALKQEGAIKKTEMFSLKDPFAWEFFVRILSLISVNTTEGQM